MSRYRWVCHGDTKLLDVGILSDGSLHNPNGYPNDLVRTAVLAADERRHQRRSNAAKQAAVTRRTRQEKRVYSVAKRLVDGGKVGPRNNCTICGRSLDDPQSITRGIGSECWQGVLNLIEQIRNEAPLLI
jgi:hypothetical protein